MMIADLKLDDWGLPAIINRQSSIDNSRCGSFGNPMKGRLLRVALLLFGSGMTALIYQVAWMRELRLIFGFSTAASAAVLAIFMGGLANIVEFAFARSLGHDTFFDVEEMRQLARSAQEDRPAVSGDVDWAAVNRWRVAAATSQERSPVATAE
jgi:hypothetical protein